MTTMTKSRLIRTGTRDERRLLRAARRDGPDANLRRNILLSVGVGTVVVTHASTSVAASAGAHGMGTALRASFGAVSKWLGIASYVAMGGLSVGVSGDVSHAVADSSLSAVHAAPVGERTTLAPPDRVATLGLAQSARTSHAFQDARPAQTVRSSLERRGQRVVAAKPELPSHASARFEVAEEVRLVDAARAAIRSGDAARCLDVLSERKQRFPKGVLAPEAAMLRISALKISGQSAQAKREAEQFLTRYASGPLANKVRATLSALESERREE
jgi:hypothetical protein